MSSADAHRIALLVADMRKRLRDLMHHWILFVTWTDLLLASWPVQAEELRQLVPAPLEIDTFDGTGWVSLVSFKAENMRFRGFDPLPGQADFCELNLRTYVRLGDVPGVYFLSLDCPGALANLLGKHLFQLPFKRCEMRIDRVNDEYRVESQRTEPGEPRATYDCRFRPIGQPGPLAPASLDEFLINRLSLFVAIRGQLFRGDIAHAPWMVQPAELTVQQNSVTSAAGLQIPKAPPHAAFAPATDALIYPLTIV